MVVVDQEEEQEEGESLWVPCLQMEQLCWWNEMSARHIHHIYSVYRHCYTYIYLYACVRTCKEVLMVSFAMLISSIVMVWAMVRVTLVISSRFLHIPL